VADDGRRNRMSAAGSGSSQRENEDTIEQGATPLELFFDLVFVFALTQITSFLSHHLAWAGMLQGAVLLAELTSFTPMAYACRCSVLRKYTNRSGNTLVSK
jgi:Bacterial low temperature requirement A protein (LtrA)